MEQRDDDQRGDDGGFRRIVEAGAEIAGATSGVVTGLALAGPAGAFAGAAAGPAVALVMKDVIRRVLSRREEKRVGGVFLAASSAYEELIANGATLRRDGFFEAQAGDRSSAEEVFEGVLLAAKAEHQERKIPYLGHLMANIAFDETLDPSLANWAILTAEDLTWTQFLLLSAIGREGQFVLPEGDYGKHAQTWNAWGLHRQLSDLAYAERNMVGAPRIKTEEMALPLINMNMRELKLQGSGFLLFHLLWLDRVPDRDVSGVVAELEAASPLTSAPSAGQP